MHQHRHRPRLPATLPSRETMRDMGCCRHGSLQRQPRERGWRTKPSLTPIFTEGSSGIVSRERTMRICHCINTDIVPGCPLLCPPGRRCGTWVVAVTDRHSGIRHGEERHPRDEDGGRSHLRCQRLPKANELGWAAEIASPATAGRYRGIAMTVKKICPSALRVSGCAVN